jgi:hypothetical protein
MSFLYDVGISQSVSEIADLTALIDIHIQKRAAASQGKCCVRSLLLVDLQQSFQREIGYHIAVVAEYGLVLVQQIFNIFESPCCI